jgi:hypothetical protein
LLTALSRPISPRPRAVETVHSREHSPNT